MKKSGKDLKQLFDAIELPQCNINLPVKDKIKVLNNEQLKNLTNQMFCQIAPAGRILVRASGTEDLVRIMVEHPDQEIAESLAHEIKDFIEEITDNFSTLFVETFYLRYLDQFGEENILKDINYTKDMLLKKIDEKIQQKLESN